MVRTTRPSSLASSNGVFLHFDLSSAGSSTQGTSGSSTITSAGLPCRKVPPGSPRMFAGALDIDQACGERRDQRCAILLRAQRRLELEEGAVGPDVDLVQREMVD